MAIMFRCPKINLLFPKLAYCPSISLLKKIIFLHLFCWKTRAGSIEVLLAESEDSLVLRFGIIKRRISYYQMIYLYFQTLIFHKLIFIKHILFIFNQTAKLRAETEQLIFKLNMIKL